jgi:hypothetical protein
VQKAHAAIIRITGGDFRLLHRLLTQMARLVEINALSQVTRGRRGRAGDSGDRCGVIIMR